MITLKSVRINKYKSIETEQSFDVEKEITTLVGKNESGKTAILEAIAKSNYLDDDPGFKFDVTTDYPRKEKKKFDKSGKDVDVIVCTYEISKDFQKEIQEDVGPKTFTISEFTYTRKYRTDHGQFGQISVNSKAFLEYKFQQNKIKDKDFKTKVEEINSLPQINSLIALTESQEQKDFLQTLKPYFENKGNWTDPIQEYVLRKLVHPQLPKFLYFDEYYALPSEVDIKKLQQGAPQEQALKTAKALFDLADINTADLLNDNDYESYKAELEATSNEITATLFKYWKTNTNLRVEFDIQKLVNPRGNNPPEVNPILKIRVHNEKYQMTLPLASRSKGFNWFFSFIVWFSKIQVDPSSNYILLLDEPGLNLHATAQEDLRRYIDDLAKDYQVIYTTHSPFMVDPNRLERVRTVLETNEGTKISDSIQEKDPDTLFPLQAALGYDIAQNLFIGKNNLLIEGASDLIYLTVLSGILEKKGRMGLRSDVTLTPVGGLDKVVSFISLLRGQRLKIVCLLDTFTDQKGKKRLQNLIQEKIIKDRDVHFFDEFAAIQGGEADLEDLFEKEEYLKLFNATFDGEHKKLSVGELGSNQRRILPQISSALGIPRFNHYRPANELARMGTADDFFSPATLNRFEKMFKAINKLF